MNLKLLRQTVAFTEFLICMASFSQTSIQPHSTEISEAAFKSNAEYLQILMIERKPPPATPEYDIPPQYWTEGIKALKPVRIYSHLLNVAIVLHIRDGVEEGIYISNPISSYAPIGKHQDGFEFMRRQDEPNVIYFKRSIPGSQKSK